MKKLTSSHGCKSNAKTARITTVKSMKTAYTGVKKADRNNRRSHRLPSTRRIASNAYAGMASSIGTLSV